MSQLGEHEIYMYVGSYTNTSLTGIRLYAFNISTGASRAIESYSNLTNPSYLAIDSKHHRLYAVSETMEYNGSSGGSVAAFTIKPDTGQLTFLNQQPTHGGAPCYVSIDAEGEYLLVANYAGGSVTIFPIDEQGGLGHSSDVVQHRGSGAIAERQEGPHAHSILMEPLNNYAFVADLGSDKLFLYSIDHKDKVLQLRNEVSVSPGAGPRHLTFNSTGTKMYLCNELNSTVTVFTFEREKVLLEPIQTISTLPVNFNESNTCADIHLSPNGSYLYVSNRGHDSIAVFSVEGSNGMIDLIEVVPTGGRTPRNFAITPNGAYLLAANQHSNSINIFAVDQVTGRINLTDAVIEVPEPVCIQWLERRF